MIRYVFLITVLCVIRMSGYSQIIAGPMLGAVEYRTAKLWAEISTGSDVYLSMKDTSSSIYIDKVITNKFGFEYVMFTIVGLEPGTHYQYTLNVSNPKSKLKTTVEGHINTPVLWPYRMPAPDVFFLTGSCAYINEPQYDRPGKPYGSSPRIFQTMAKEDSSAGMVWLGDNWYFREVDFGSEYGLYYRPHHDRAIPEFQDLLRAMPHYAQWDDHDYGPNNSDKSYNLKREAREAFMTLWPNPTFGLEGEGIYTRIPISDIEIFMLDDRWYRENDELSNVNKEMYGAKQLAWLQNALTQSHATFKIIATGSQALNDVSPYDCFCHYTTEFDNFLKFLTTEKVSGVLFLSGDRHHSSIVEKQVQGYYTLYDITVSPFTSDSYKFAGVEKNHPHRILGIAESQNYAKISVSGSRKNRILQVEFKDIDGKTINTWSINENELKVKQ